MRHDYLKAIHQIWRKSANVLYKVDASKPKKRKTFKVEDSSFGRLRYCVASFSSIMKAENLETETSSVFSPPSDVKGMTVLRKEAFSKEVMVKGMVLVKKDIQRTQKLWKSVQLKRRGIQPIAELGEKDPLRSTHSLVLLDPEKIEAQPFSPEARERLGLESGQFKEYPITFTYENWSVQEVMRAVLPSDADNVSSFTQIGHIAHLNLREESMPFKRLIGEVILDKIASVGTVVNKVNSIDNTFRNFQMELLAGEDNYVTQLREHGCTFELDFSKVYWNSRLSGEHSRIVELIERGSTVYDVFAGIGPFAIPLAKKKQCKVYANDLNPASFESLKKNVTLNKINSDQIVPYNMDGRDFIRTVVKDKLTEFIVQTLSNKSRSDTKNCDSETTKDSTITADKEADVERTGSKSSNGVNHTYVVMNLPGLAIEFLDAFNSLLKDLPSELKDSLPSIATVLPKVFCYTFEHKSDAMDSLVQKRGEQSLGSSIPGEVSVRWVRNVAPKKEMMCLCFKLWPELLLGEQGAAGGEDSQGQFDQDEEPDSKKQRLS